MAYIRLQDYYNKRIQQAQLGQITQNRDAVRLSCESEAIAEVTSYLVQRYDLAEELTDTKTYSNTETFKPKARYELDATAYSASSTYAVKDLVLQGGKVYSCKTAIGTPEAFNAAKWNLIGNQYDLFYVAIPYDYYDYSVNYSVGDKVFFKGKAYECKVSNQNVSPLDQNYGLSYWGSGISVSFTDYFPFNTPADLPAYSNVTAYTAGVLVNYNGTAYVCVQANTGQAPTLFKYWAPISWTAGDNRSQQLIGVILDCAIRKMHVLIAPNNVPQIREDNYDLALQWLKEAGGQNNAITADVPLLQPLQGKRIRWGSGPKNINSY